MKYEAPRVITMSADMLVAALGPSVSCSAFAGTVTDLRDKG